VASTQLAFGIMPWICLILNFLISSSEHGLHQSAAELTSRICDWSCMFVHRPRVDLRVLFDLFFGGIQACGMTSGARWPKLQGFQASQLELRIVWPSRYQRHGEKPQRAGTVTNLPILNVGTWDGRSSLVACATDTHSPPSSTQLFAHDRRTIY
jgi:hypothetical protein